jgi:hypothetical protein
MSNQSHHSEPRISEPRTMQSTSVLLKASHLVACSLEAGTRKISMSFATALPGRVRHFNLTF